MQGAASGTSPVQGGMIHGDRGVAYGPTRSVGYRCLIHAEGCLRGRLLLLLKHICVKWQLLNAYTLIAIVLLLVLHFFVSSICERLVEQGSGLVAQLGDS